MATVSGANAFDLVGICVDQFHFAVQTAYDRGGGREAGIERIKQSLRRKRVERQSRIAAGDPAVPRGAFKPGALSRADFEP